LPFPANDLSFKQKHPANNAIAPVWREFRELPPKSLEWHDVGSEYAVYMVGSPAKSAFRQAAEQPVQGPKFLTPAGALPIRPRFLKGSDFQPPPRLQRPREAGDKRISRCRGAAN
jgi:hypothetical protein